VSASISTPVGPVVSVVMKGWCFVLTLRFLMDE